MDRCWKERDQAKSECARLRHCRDHNALDGVAGETCQEVAQYAADLLLDFQVEQGKLSGLEEVCKRTAAGKRNRCLGEQAAVGGDSAMEIPGCRACPGRG